MALRDTLVYVDRTKDSLSNLRLAGDLAWRQQSRLTALYLRDWTPEQLYLRSRAEMGLISGGDLERLKNQVAASMDIESDDLESALEAWGRETGLPTEWRVAEGHAATVVPQHARYADLCVLGHHRDTDDDPNGYTLSERLLFSSGRPVLSIPAGYSGETLGRHIAVAWNSSRAAARAVNDAMPMIEVAERTTVITINAEQYIDRNGALPVDHLVAHLRRHGAQTELVELKSVPSGAIGDTLQAKAREMGADLMVAGAFGHPRLWERLLGGATLDLLDHMSLPIVMSN